MIVLLDTTVLIYALRGEPTRSLMLKEMAMAGHTLATAAINVSEVYAGLRHGEETVTATLFRALVCYPMTFEIAIRAGLLRRDAASRGKTFALADMIVAATAIEHGLTILTDSKKDFAVPGVALF